MSEKKIDNSLIDTQKLIDYLNNGRFRTEISLKDLLDAIKNFQKEISPQSKGNKGNKGNNSEFKETTVSSLGKFKETTVSCLGKFKTLHYYPVMSKWMDVDLDKENKKELNDEELKVKNQINKIKIRVLNQKAKEMTFEPSWSLVWEAYELRFEMNKKEYFILFECEFSHKSCSSEGNMAVNCEKCHVQSNYPQSLATLQWLQCLLQFLFEEKNISRYGFYSVDQLFSTREFSSSSSSSSA
jgi:hypothetical protein